MKYPRTLTITVVLSLALLSVALPAAADPPLDGGNGWTNYPNPDAAARTLGEIPPSQPFTSLANIAAAFNNARAVENGDICPGGACEPNATQMPTNFAFPAGYSSLSPTDKALFILNAERTARGLAPFVDANAEVTQLAQAWAQQMATTNVFAHRTNTTGDLAAICGAACAGQLGAVTENLYASFGSSSTYIVETAIYLWMYQDRTGGGSFPDQRWGHRHALLWNNLSDNHGSAGSEGYIGIGIASSAGGWTYLVWNAADTGPNWPMTGFAPGTCNNVAPTINMQTNGGNGIGTPGNDVILGTNGNDYIDGMGGNDLICGLDGNDTIFGMGGVDTIFGGGGTDFIQGGAENDVVNGGDDADTIYILQGADTVNAGDGSDFVWGGALGDTINGGPGADFIVGNGGVDTIDGGPGNDGIFGGPGDDIINGGADQNVLFGEAGMDQITGGTSVDVIFGGPEGDTIQGGGGNDVMFGEAGGDVITGGSAVDIIFGGPDADALIGNGANDLLFGEGGGDSLFGGAGGDYLDGGADNDTLDGGTDSNVGIGGAGFDRCISIAFPSGCES